MSNLKIGGKLIISNALKEGVSSQAQLENLIKDNSARTNFQCKLYAPVVNVEMSDNKDVTMTMEQFRKTINEYDNILVKRGVELK